MDYRDNPETCSPPPQGGEFTSPDLGRITLAVTRNLRKLYLSHPVMNLLTLSKAIPCAMKQTQLMHLPSKVLLPQPSAPSCCVVLKSVSVACAKTLMYPRELDAGALAR